MNKNSDNRESDAREAPRASIIVCVHNRGEEVQSCLQSLRCLTNPDFEIVLVDDASTDDTPTRLEAFKSSHADLSVTIVRNAANLGVSGSRNVGTEAASGSIVLFTDSDCVADPHWLERMVAGFTNDTVAAVGGTVLNPPPGNLAERAYVGRSCIGRSIVQSRRLVGCNMAFRRDVLLRFGFDPALTYYCDEDDIARRLQRFGYDIAFVPDAIVHHHHRLTTRSYLRMGYRQGLGAARLWYKQGTYIGRDLVCVALAVVTAPLILVDARMVLLPLACAAGQLGAIAYNEWSLKGKGALGTLRVYPMALLYYAMKVAGYTRTMLLIAFGGEREIRASKAHWRRRLMEPVKP